MAIDLLGIANRALVRLGAKKIASLTEETDRAVACNEEADECRVETLRAHPWNCARKRAYLNGLAQAALNPGAGATTQGASVTFTATAASFVVGRDEEYRIIGNGGVARITSVLNTTSVQAEIVTPFADLNQIPVEGWRIAPAWGWEFRFPKPADYIRLVELQGTSIRGHGASILWSWWRDLNTFPEPVKVEGEFLVSNVGGKVNIAYTKDLTDISKWDSLAKSALTALLAFRISYAVTGSLQAAKTQHDAYKEILAEARTMNGQEGSADDSGSAVLLDIRA